MNEQGDQLGQDGLKYSVVIPVYNSERIVGETIDRTVDFFEREKLDYEIILVNDGSSDNSFEILKEKARLNKNIIAVDLLKNYGQHTANFCGFKKSTGDYLITMDDDLQNPPEEIAKLINAVKDGYDVVFGVFREKKHAGYRKIGTRIISFVNRKIFGKPKDLILSNFRIIRRDVVDRICQYKTGYPYIPGLVLMFSSKQGNVLVEHHERKVGKSGYTLFKIAELVMRILFNYSSYPLRLVAFCGIGVSLASFLLGGFYLLKAFFHKAAVPGWTTVVVLLSFFNGIALLVLGMLGEYLIRLVNQTSSSSPYQIKESVNCD
ncbi:undecaprenyl-phosphate 4-deoxy-4-formamido-L-arabinose transferase [Geothermobacter ehrlichii]|uniref:Undecaprenyl-phosphate 4-deoxy-4-formamido-L-arabinose transferase n=1 Tax=Geothermobacter ehrlichii TaxID=213224 RepID=A0A5D3WLK8_9BACT|nr:glycosyltransferase [Geothermobacter ehrlichii]TYO99024.1 undecaprenyl-phosphate 4-deoxy-4-formamido-L-arabinose transferase [Geothermobacter ehrlichii]